MSPPYAALPHTIRTAIGARGVTSIAYTIANLLTGLIFVVIRLVRIVGCRTVVAAVREPVAIVVCRLIGGRAGRGLGRSGIARIRNPVSDCRPPELITVARWRGRARVPHRVSVEGTRIQGVFKAVPAGIALADREICIGHLGARRWQRAYGDPTLTSWCIRIVLSRPERRCLGDEWSAEVGDRAWRRRQRRVLQNCHAGKTQ